MKGPGAEEELREAERAIAALGGKAEGLRVYTLPGTERKHNVIVIRKVKDTPDRYPRRWAQMKKQPL